MLYLNFHDHIISVDCKEDDLLEKIRNEFHYFARKHEGRPQTKVEVFKGPAPEMPSMVAVKLLPHAAIYHLGHKQYIDYFGKALLLWDHEAKTLKIYSSDEERLYELAFISIHSLLGQALEKKGLIRVHALAVSLAKTNAVIMLPSGGGKSTLLKHLLDNPAIKIISDDMPLIDFHGRVHPFPSKLALEAPPSSGPLAELNWHEFKREFYPPKWTASLSQLQTRIDTDSPSKQTLLIAGIRLSNGRSLLSEVSKWKMLMPILEHMVIGVGLPQIIEMFLKFKWSDMFKLAHHGSLRTWSAFHLVRNSKCFYFYIGPDKTNNSQLIMELLNEHQSS